MNFQIIPYVFCQEVALYPLCNPREGRKEADPGSAQVMQAMPSQGDHVNAGQTHRHRKP